MLGHLASLLACFLRSQVKWFVLLVLIKYAQLLSLCYVDDCEHSGDGLAKIVTTKSIISVLV